MKLKPVTKVAIPLSIVAISALSACGSAEDENSITGAFSASFEESWSKEFVEGCVTESVKAGAVETESRPICECLRDELDQSLDGLTEKMNPPKAKLDEATKACMPEM